MQNVGTKTQTFKIALQTADVVSVLESTLVTMQLFTEGRKLVISFWPLIFSGGLHIRMLSPTNTA